MNILADGSMKVAFLIKVVKIGKQTGPVFGSPNCYKVLKIYNLVMSGDDVCW